MSSISSFESQISCSVSPCGIGLTPVVYQDAPKTPRLGAEECPPLRDSVEGPRCWGYDWGEGRRGRKEGMTTVMMKSGGWRYWMRNAQWYWNNPMQWSHR